MNSNSNQLSSQIFDVCVVGDGASALWAAHGFHKAGRKVLWISSEEPGSVSRSLLKHGWVWNVTPEHAQSMLSYLGIEDSAADLKPYEIVYFDARSSKRFKKLAESRVDWGDHELPLLPEWLAGPGEGALDLSPAHEQVWRRYTQLEGLMTKGLEAESMVFEMSQEPLLLIAKSFVVVGLKTEGKKITGIEIAAKGSAAEKILVQAEHFVLGDIGESYADLTQDEDAADALRTAQKGKSFKSGFSLEFIHGDNFAIPVQQTMVIPLVANPSKKGQGSHIVGRFWIEEQTGRVASSWFGLLNEEELEDNNEILKKMKSSRRAIERAIPGFDESIIKESLTFEPHMFAGDLLKKRNNRVLDADLVTDVFGPSRAAGVVAQLVVPAEGI